MNKKVFIILGVVVVGALAYINFGQPEKNLSVDVGLNNTDAAWIDQVLNPVDVSIENTTHEARFPNVWVGDKLLVTVTGKPLTAYKFCYTRAGLPSQGDCNTSITTNSAGVWTTSISTSSNTPGLWQRWVKNTTERSTIVAYVLRPAPTAKVVVGNTTASTRFPQVKQGDQLKFLLKVDPSWVDGSNSRDAYYQLCLNSKCYGKSSFQLGGGAIINAEAYISKFLYQNKGKYTMYMKVFPKYGNLGSFKSNTITFTVN